MGERYVVVQTTGGRWHRLSCLWAHVGARRRRRERVVSEEEVSTLGRTCQHCLGE